MLGADYHKPTGTPEKINYNLMRKRAQLVFYTAWEMANCNDMLKRHIPPEAQKDSNHNSKNHAKAVPFWHCFYYFVSNHFYDLRNQQYE
jgi:hypothetical protein